MGRDHEPAAWSDVAALTAAEIAAALRGDHRARERVARRALALALPTARGVLRRHEGSEDVAQEVAVQVLARLDRLRDPDRFEAWVHRITVRRTLEALARRRSREEHEAPLHELDPSAPVAGATPTDAVDERLAQQAAIRAALATVPPRQALALVLRYVHDLPEREVARALRCRPGTAAALLSRGRAALRETPLLVDFGPSGREP